MCVRDVCVNVCACMYMCVHACDVCDVCVNECSVCVCVLAWISQKADPEVSTV